MESQKNTSIQKTKIKSLLFRLLPIMRHLFPQSFGTQLQLRLDIFSFRATERTRLLTYKCYLFFTCFLFLFTSYKCKGQNMLHRFQLNGGFISQKPVDIYLGKLDYIPQLNFNNYAFRVGAQLGILYTRKCVSVSAGMNTSIRLYKISMMNKSFLLGGIYLRPAFEWTSSSEKILSATLSIEFTQIAFNINYGREFHFDQNWISYGFVFIFSKTVGDE